MSIFLRIKKCIIKVLTCFIFDKTLRKNVRNFLYYFSFKDYIKFKNQKFVIVSLGANCLPRVLCTAAKLKPRRIYGEKSMPFDLCLSYNFDKMIEFIETDFASFFDGINYNNELGYWQNEQANIAFLHDKNPDKEIFIKKYKKRIENFQNIFNSEKRPAFVYYSENNENKSICAEQITRLYEVLKNKRGSNDFDLVILNNPYLEVNNIIQICEPFKNDDMRWAEYMLNEYQNFNNKYTDYVKLVGNDLNNLLIQN